MIDFGKVWLAPLTKGGNLPFRRLCVEFGAEITVSEMIVSRELVRGNRKEKALLRRHPSEKVFGVQLAARDSEETLKAIEIALESGCDFIDINCGCPIEEITRRGLGSALLKKPRALENLVSFLVKRIPVPLTVKIRLGWKESEVVEIAKGLEQAGAAALIVHGRTREQRYQKPARWDEIAKVKQAVSIPVIGNGDILTWWDVEDKITLVDGVMVARGALIKPWIFKEIKEKRTFNMSEADLRAVYDKFELYLRDHFGSDEFGIKRSREFMMWHFEFFERYRYFSEELHRNSAYPLMQTRQEQCEFSLKSIYCETV